MRIKTEEKPKRRKSKKDRSSRRLRVVPLILGFFCLLLIISYVFLGTFLPSSSNILEKLTHDCIDSAADVFCNAAKELKENCKHYGLSCRKTCGLCETNGDEETKKAGREKVKSAIPQSSAEETESAAEEVLDLGDEQLRGKYNFELGEIGKEEAPITVFPEKWKLDVEGMFQTAFNDYKTHCWGMDEIWPVKKRCHNWVSLGLTIVDNLDVLHLLGMTDEFNAAREWVSENLRFDDNRFVSFFETIIRVLGGLLSAYDMSNDQMFLDKAVELADRLMPAFDSPTGIPYGQINLRTGEKRNPGWTGGSTLLAEAGTIQMEFWYLSNRTGDSKYFEKAQHVINILDFEHPSQNLPALPLPGLYPVYIDPKTLRAKTSHITWGGLGDSFYEYLLKMWILTGKSHEQYRRMYVAAVKGMLEHLWKTVGGYSFIAEWRKGGRTIDKMDHLACFAGGLLALGVKEGAVNGEEAALHLRRARELAFTCHSMYSTMNSGLSPDSVKFGNGQMILGDNFYLLRPETVETFFVLYQVTKDDMYRKWGWEIYQRIVQHCRVKGWGFAPVKNVDRHKPEKDAEGKMQSFLLAETFKYLWLLFNDDIVLPLNRFVFNTEAHPLSVYSSK